MPVAIPDFWKLLLESQLLTRQQCQVLATRFGSAQGGAADAQALAQWLVAQNVITQYQATVLLAGRAGPFCFGDYKVRERLDRGRLAGWFRAEHAATRHPVTLKFLTGMAAHDPAMATVAAAVSATDHPRLVRFHEAVNLGAYRFVVAEELPGETLSERLPAGRMKPSEVLRLAHGLATALAHLHQRGRLHGDVRPSNVWLTAEGSARLLFEPDSSVMAPPLTQPAPEGDWLARADYLAPEFLMAGKLPDPLTDIYALGCTIYEALTGQPPFPGGTMKEKMRRHAAEAIQPLEPLGVPKPVAQLVAFMMAKNPAVRFQQAAAIAEKIVQMAGPAVAAVPPAPSRPTLAAFETALQQKQPAATAPSPAAPSPTTGSPRIAKPAAAPAPLTAPQSKAPSAPTATPGKAGAVSVPVPPAAPVPPAPSAKPAVPVVPAVPVTTAPSAAPAVPVVPAVPVARAVPVAPVAPAVPMTPTVAAGPPAAPLVAAAPAIPAVVAPRQPTRRAKRQSQSLIWAGSLAALLVLGLLGGGLAWSLMNGQSGGQVSGGDGGAATGSGGTSVAVGEQPDAATSSTQESAPPEAAAAGAMAEAIREVVVEDDGKLLWASPVAGAPIQIKYLPQGARIILFLRPADLLRQPEGERMFRALGPDFATARAGWEQAAGFNLTEIDRLTLGVYANEGQMPQVVSVVELSEPLHVDALLTRWGNPSPVADLASVYQRGPLAYYLPSGGEQRTFVVGPLTPEFREMLQGAELRLNRDLARLLQASNEQRQFTLVFARDFLYGEGAPLFSGSRARVLDSLDWFFGTGVKAGLVSLHVGDTFYFELLLQNDVTIDPQTLAGGLKTRIDEIPDKVETYLYSLTPPTYWKPVFISLKPMISEWHRFTRVGVENGQVTINSVLPSAAAHNLAAGGEMLLTLSPGASVEAAVAAQPAGPKSLLELLQRNIALNFGELDLEFAMREIERSVQDDFKGLPFAFKIAIAGSDLEQEGITRNQKVREFNMQASVADILTGMVRKANPVTTVQDPSEVNQKLLWVVAPDPSNPSNQIILITTRKAAEGKYTLPDVFRPKS